MEKETPQAETPEVIETGTEGSTYVVDKDGKKHYGMIAEPGKFNGELGG